MKGKYSKKSPKKNYQNTLRNMQNKLEKDIVLTVPQIQEETRLTENRLMDYVSEENIQDLRRFAFEWAYQEIEYKKIPRKAYNSLFILRKYQAFTEAYGVLYSTNKKNPKALQLTFTCPFEDIPSLIRK
jgi:hypothetical protein